MSKPFNYSKWDNIELSDDESDLHPNIDKDSWFRLKHRTRLEREEREDLEVKEAKEKNAEDGRRINVIQARLKSISQGGEDDDAQFEDTEALEVELKELQQHIENRNKRMEEIHEKRQWNIDNICKVKEEKTVVSNVQSKSLKADIEEDIDESSSITATAIAQNTATKTTTAATTEKAPTTVFTAPTKVAEATSSSSTGKSAAVTTTASPVAGPEPGPIIKRERMAVISYNDYAIKHERILETFSEIVDMEKTKEYLFKHCDILLHEHAQSYILLSCLEDEMNGKHDRMKLVCRQSQILTHIHELGRSMRRDPRDVILPFFKRIEEPEYLNGFQSAVNDFINKIAKRAIEKRKEMDADRVAHNNANGDEEDEEDEVEYEGADEAVLGPGGLNPIQVLKSLPKILRRAFESQDIEELQRVLGAMKPEEAKYWMKQCVDSGLWVAKDPTVFDEEHDAEEVEEDGEEQEE